MKAVFIPDLDPHHRDDHYLVACAAYRTRFACGGFAESPIYLC